MNSDKVKNFIFNEIEKRKIFYARPIFKGLKINVYNMSFGAITIDIRGAFGCVSGYVSNYEAIAQKIADFLHRSSFNLYEQYYNKHHKQGGRK